MSVNSDVPSNRNASAIVSGAIAPNWRDLLLVLVSLAIVLRLMGRTWWCKCGGFSPWSWQVKSEHNSQHLIDAYSFTHLLHGFVFFALLWLLRERYSPRLRLLAALVVEAAWEVVENSPFIIERYRAATISLDYYGDSIANSLCDVLSMLLGYLIASRLRWYQTLAIMIVVELVLLATIRDSLLLNVIMLIYPLDAILQWQSG
ncbi:DUF2585 family protein [Stieleria sp. TO1_6]|uniref:DUF2585 family protein n=1 Tax=Stieleria tagensis TaxID=2956795 RepID=UPI00209BAFD3|nr:DUF2585 family protein [Stieleria tagensis]MCO8122646.1 DUF2585 family protein [Stieleria tagensis]